MLVGENPDIFPASKATTLETNKSLSSRPRPGGTAAGAQASGKPLHPPYLPLPSRSRRHATLKHDLLSSSGLSLSLSGVVDSSVVDVVHETITTAPSNEGHALDESLQPYGMQTTADDSTALFDSSSARPITIDILSGMDFFTPNTETVTVVSEIPPTTDFPSNVIVESAIPFITGILDPTAKDKTVSSYMTNTLMEEDDSTTKPIVVEQTDNKEENKTHITNIDPSMQTLIVDAQTISAAELFTALSSTERDNSLLIIKPNNSEMVDFPEEPAYQIKDVKTAFDASDLMQQDELTIVNYEKDEQESDESRDIEDVINNKDITFRNMGNSGLDHNKYSNDLPFTEKHAPREIELNAFPKNNNKFNSPQKKVDYESKHGGEFNNKLFNSTNYMSVNNANNSYNSVREISLTSKTQTSVSSVEKPLPLDAGNNSSRVVVNVTISSEGTGDSLPRPLYVLSIYVPTNPSAGSLPDVKINPIEVKHGFGNNGNPNTVESLQVATTPASTTTERQISTTVGVQPVITTTLSGESLYGGQCLCSCPVCMDNYNSDNITDPFYDNYVDSEEEVEPLTGEEINPSVLKNVTGETKFTEVAKNVTLTSPVAYDEVYSTSSINPSSWESSTLTDEITSSSEEPTSTEFTSEGTTEETTEGNTEQSTYTETSCPMVTTPLPPPPTILILEGKAIFYISLFV